jgi:hypothetical protein
VQLAAGFEQFFDLCEMFEPCLAQCGTQFEDRWHKDKKIFSLASGARKARTEKALAELLNR